MYKKTKIVATISDLRCEVNFIKELFDAGMNVARINSAHVSLESATQVVKNIRQVSDRIAILIDTKGPELRITAMSEKYKDGIKVAAEDILRVTGSGTNEESSLETIYINDSHVYEDVYIGAYILIDDGDIELEVIAKKNDVLICKVMNGGIIKGKKSVNIPNVKINLPSLTPRDKEFIQWAMDMDIDFIAHSFVRRKSDVMEVKQILKERGSHIKIISKIENQEGVDNIDEILDETYGIMVARGDLGVEMAAEQIPVTQRRIVNKCIESKKPVIIATQMLHSMIMNPRPTRAEVSDIASAIYQRVDAIMLSGETANGDYPIEAISTMSRIAREIEKDTSPISDINMIRINNEVTAQLARSAVRASINLPIKAIVIDSMTGRTGRYLATFRGQKPVYAVCYRPYVMRELALSYGIEATYHKPSITQDTFPLGRLLDLEGEGKLSKDDMIVVVGGRFGTAAGASFMEISTVQSIVNKAMGND